MKNPDLNKPIIKTAVTPQIIGALMLTQPLQQGRAAFLSAASGLVRHGNHFFVVADDELQLGIFSAEPLHDLLQPGHTIPLQTGVLPLDPIQRKRVKPDFEVLTLLPPTQQHLHGALLIMGSGSTSQRRRGLLLALDEQGFPQLDKLSTLDFSALYATLERDFGIVNIEGATVQHEHLLLLQRGNKKNGVNAIVQLDLMNLLKEMTTTAHSSATTDAFIGNDSLRNIQAYTLGSIDGVALGFTDATCLPDQHLIALAVAEDTDDPYADGATLGSYVCRFDRDNRLHTLIPLATAAKTEGIAVWRAGSNSATTWLGFVTDADDPTIPASLLMAPLSSFD